MELAHRWIDRNLTRLELVVAWIIIAVFIGIFMRYMLLVFARAEHVMVETTITNINSSLKYHAALAALNKDKDFLTRIRTESPYRIIETAQQAYYTREGPSASVSNIQLKSFLAVPENYIGVLFNPDPSDIDAGLWYYDMTDNTLNYRVRNSEFFYSDQNGVPLIKYRVTFDYSDVNGNGSFDTNIDVYHSIELRRVGNYIWVD